jgi:hypothetical protein
LWVAFVLMLTIFHHFQGKNCQHKDKPHKQEKSHNVATSMEDATENTVHTSCG